MLSKWNLENVIILFVKHQPPYTTEGKKNSSI